MTTVREAIPEDLAPEVEAAVAWFNRREDVAFEVTGIDEAIVALSDAGARLIDERPRSGGKGTRIAFVHPSSFDGLLVELVERL